MGRKAIFCEKMYMKFMQTQDYIRAVYGRQAFGTIFLWRFFLQHIANPPYTAQLFALANQIFLWFL